MTIKERLISMLGFTPDVNAIDAALLDVGLDGSVDYESMVSPYSLPLNPSPVYKSIRLAAIGIMEILLSTANTSNQITGYSVTFDRGAIERRLNLLKTEAGLITGSKIRALNLW